MRVLISSFQIGIIFVANLANLGWFMFGANLDDVRRVCDSNHEHVEISETRNSDVNFAEALDGLLNCFGAELAYMEALREYFRK